MNRYRVTLLILAAAALLAVRLILPDTGVSSSSPLSPAPFAPVTNMGAKPIPGSSAPLIKNADPESAHPVERATARGLVLDARIARTSVPEVWTRTLLVRSEVQPRPVRVVETWRHDIAQPEATCLRREMFLADQLIVSTRPGISPARLRAALSAEDLSLLDPVSANVWTVRLATADLDAAPEALRRLATLPELVTSAEYDGVGFGSGLPNDTNFSSQWGLSNNGALGGTAGADVAAAEFWTILENTPGITVAVLDSGLNFTHPDLQNIAWSNPGEIPGDGIDNDASGKIDDITGWDFVNSDNLPADDQGHGSNVTGIIAANRNNGLGVAGLIGGVRILVCKVLNSTNSGLTSHLIAATTYARQRGVPIMNLSLQNYPYSASLDVEFTACRDAGIVLSACAGNQGTNNDLSPNYPSSYPHPNIIAVGNHDRTDVRWAGSFNPSNYGLASVDLFAPGRDILSPILGTAYSSYTGTSQATPYVTAVCAALKFTNPSWTAPDIKTAILNSVVTRPAYNTLCGTGGRLHAANAMGYALSQQPATDTDDDGFANLVEYLAGTRIDAAANRPEPSTDLSAGMLQLSLPQMARNNARFRIETSTDLATWTSAGVTDSSTTQLLRGSVLLAGQPRVFLRIVAEPVP